MTNKRGKIRVRESSYDLRAYQSS